MARWAFGQRRILLSRLRASLRQMARFVWKYATRAAVNLIVWAVVFSFYITIFYTRIKDRLQPVLRRAGQAAQGYSRWLQARVEPYAVSFATGLVTWTVVFAFYAVLFSTRIQAAGNETFQTAADTARRSGHWLIDRLHNLWLDFLDRPRWKNARLVPVFQLMLLGLIFSAVFMRPTQAMAPNEIWTPTPTQTATFTPTATLTPTFTPTATITPTLEPTSTPTLAITAISYRQGEGNCGQQDGMTGTGSFVWPTTNNKIWGYYAPGWGHYGIDIDGSMGNDVVAADSGIVVFAGWNVEGYGNLLVVDHGNGYQTLYAHLSSMQFDCGDRVQQGETIGAIGSTGWSTCPHLHFEIVKAGYGNMDPLQSFEQ